MQLLLFVILPQAQAPEILERHCLRCHNEKTHKGDLDLSNGAAIKTKPDAIWRSVAHPDEPFIPNKAPKLPQADIDEIRRWAEAGMKYDRKLQSTPPKEDHWASRRCARGRCRPLIKGALWMRGATRAICGAIGTGRRGTSGRRCV